MPLLRRAGPLRRDGPRARREHRPEDNARGLLDRPPVMRYGGRSHFSHLSSHSPSTVAHRKATFRIRPVHIFPTFCGGKTRTEAIGSGIQLQRIEYL